MKKRILWLVIVLGIWAGRGARAEDKPVAPKPITALNMTESIKIDGKLLEDAWAGPGYDQFVQVSPLDGGAPSEKTTVWVAYDRDALYIAARMHDSEPGKIVKRLGRRDDNVNSDWFKLALDPYNDKRSGFVFAINPAGSLLDGVLYNDSSENDSWDGVWEGQAAIDDQGWTVEMRIPFDQLHFKNQEVPTWGVNFERIIFRKSETAVYSWRPRSESGYVSHFASLTGLRGMSAHQAVEFLPYVIGKAAFAPAETGNPFATGEKMRANLGLDIKLGLGSNLTLNATVNPDFGQVEVDPAVINLSAAETYYAEKRPFFIAGSSFFHFGIEGGVNEIGANWGGANFFYSRRIGHAPQGRVAGDGYVDAPETTAILGAIKLTGQIGDGWNIGVLSGLAAREYATIDNQGARSQQVVEPFSDYTVLRMQKEFNQGKQGLGFIATGVWRDIGPTAPLADSLRKDALTGGINGWLKLGESETWALSGWLGGTRVSGSANVIWSVQQSYPHYFQQPDADYLHPDSTATSLSGWGGRLVLNKQKGNFLFNAAVGVLSPGFDCTDLGFQYSSNVINGHVMIGYQSFTPGPLFRDWNVWLLTQRNYNFAGDKTGEQRLIAILNATLLNNWSVYGQISVNPEVADDMLTRGGPQALRPAHTWGDFSVSSDNRTALVAGANGGFDASGSGPTCWYAGLIATWKPSSNLTVSVNPNYNYSYDPAQWLQQQADPLHAATYGTRYVFGELMQRTVAMPLRLNWIFTPRLSLQAYLQPFISVGAYTSIRELARSKSFAFTTYGTNGSIIARVNGDYSVDPDGSGPAPVFMVPNPDFNLKSLRGTVVLRWEYSPGSVFYAVWTQNRSDMSRPGDWSFGPNFGDMLRAAGENIFMLKFAYRFTL
jgi:hypothetical protein